MLLTKIVTQEEGLGKEDSMLIVNIYYYIYMELPRDRVAVVKIHGLWCQLALVGLCPTINSFRPLGKFTSQSFKFSYAN